MARMWTCGYELQSTSAEFGVNSGTIVTGSPAISTTVHRAGTASLRINPSAATQYIEHQITSGVVMRTLHRLYLRVDTLPSTATNIYGIGQSGYFPALLRLQTDGTLVLRDGFIESTLTGTSAALTTGRWYRVELDYTDVSGTLTSGVSAFKGYIDGVQFADALCSNINGFSRIRMGVQLAASTDLYIDDVAINDTTGSAQTGLPGPGSVVHLRPNAAGDNNGWATAVGGTAGAGNNYTRVSERPPDDATSYNQTAVTGTTTIDDFNVEDAAAAGIGSSDTVTLVQVGGRVASDNTTAASIVYRLKGQASGTVQESASVTVANTSWSVHAGQSPRPYQLTAYVNPQGSAAWAPSALDGIQIGYRGDVSQTTVRRVSTLWALIEFQPLTSAALTLASETDSGQALGKAKARALGVPSETSTGQALARRKTKLLGIPAETGTAQALGRRKTLALGIAVETAAAQLLGRSKTRILTAASETSTALTPGRARARALASAGESTSSQALARTKRTSLTPSAEAGTARPLTGIWSTAAGPAGETASAQALSLVKARVLPPAIEADTAQALVGAKRLTLRVAAETSVSLPLAPASGLAVAEEINTAGPLGQVKTRVLGVADEVGEARPLGRARGLPVAEETAVARLLSGTHRQALAPAAETDAARPLGWLRSQALQAAEETAEARVLIGGAAGALGPAVEEDQARALPRTKARALAPSPGEVSTTRPLAGTKRLALGPAVETATAQRLLIPGAIVAAGEMSTALPVSKAKARTLSWSSETATALPFGHRAALQLPSTLEIGEARPVGQRKARAAHPASESAEARTLAAGKHRALGVAAETTRALIGPYIRLTPAIDRHLALVLIGRRQRPADHLDASTSGPVLTPSTSGPALAASTSGPRLAASTTTGG